MSSPAQGDLEARLAEKLAAGERDEVASAAIRGYGPEVLGYLTSVMRDVDDADEAFSIFAENLWSTIGQFRGECSFKSWCYKLAWTALTRVTRDPYRRRRDRLATSVAERLAVEVRTSTAPHLAQAAPDRLARLRAALRADEQTMLILRLDRGLGWREIADVLAEEGQAVEEAALRKRFERLTEKLRKLATEQGLLGG